MQTCACTGTRACGGVHTQSRDPNKSLVCASVRQEQRYQVLTSEKGRSQCTCVCGGVCAGGSAERKTHKDLPEKSEQGEGLF